MSQHCVMVFAINKYS